MQETLIAFEDRPSDSRVIDRVWRSQSERAGNFHSMATCNCGIVVSKYQGRTSLTVRGPETHATMADCPPDGEWFGIQFKLGTFLSLLPACELRDRNDVTLPDASGRSFWLNGSAWEYPGFDNAETFVQRLVRKGLIVTDPSIGEALRGAPGHLSRRTLQRRFLRATGLTLMSIRQITRARRAAYLLRGGAGILRVAHDLGYFDQAHLSRSLKYFIGQTPAQIFRGERQLSLLYKTDEI
jgi:hypothetical protein